jgi:D,D-heptose 1,7-bisphosphate phosphatase
MAKAVFLDRDGTINKEVNYLTEIHQIEFIPGVQLALSLLKSLGFLNIIITNQSAVARGFLTEEKLGDLHGEFYSRLALDGKSLIDDILYSPYHSDGIIEKFKTESICRKPNTGMIVKAMLRHSLDLSESFFIGDSYSDMICAQNAGITKILVLTGYGAETRQKCAEKKITVEYIAQDLPDAARFIKKCLEN